MVRITIETGNEAFQEDRAGEVAGILRHLAEQLVAGRRPALVLDLNGNRCGRVTLTGADKELAV